MPFNLFMIFVNVPFSPKKKNCDEGFLLWKKKIIFTTSSTHTHTQKILVWDNSNLLNSKLSIQPQKKKKKSNHQSPTQPPKHCQR